MKTSKLACFILVALSILSGFSNPSVADELVVTETGNVGIGVDNPISKLQIFGHKTTIPLQIGHNTGGNDFTMDIAAGQGLASLVGGAKIKSDGTGYEFLGSRGASRILLHDGCLKFYTSNSVSGTPGADAEGLQSGQEKMVITSSGLIGIGTASPKR